MVISAFTSSVLAQGKVDGNTLRLKGALFLGSLRPDFEKEIFIATLLVWNTTGIGKTIAG